ncbi:radical SAM protein [Candidatus Omnitrophota bacterium]
MKALKIPFINIRLDVINRCNIRCKMCHYSNPGMPKAPLEIFSVNDLEGFLKDIGPHVRNIYLSCGFEPLVSGDFCGIISFISGNYPHIKIIFCTNGTLLSSEIRHAVVEKGVFRVIFSIDGAVKNTFENIRKGSEYEKVFSNILELKKLKDKNNSLLPNFGFNTVLMSSNIREISSIIKIGSFVGVDFIVFRKVGSFNDEIADSDELLKYHSAKFNHYRDLAIKEAGRSGVTIRISKAFDTCEKYTSDNDGEFMDDFFKVVAGKDKDRLDNKVKDKAFDVGPQGQRASVKDRGCFKNRSLKHVIEKLIDRNTFCRYPFYEIVFAYNKAIKPCPCFKEDVGLFKDSSPSGLFFGKAFRDIRFSMFKGDGHKSCENCYNKSDYN